MVKRFRFKGKAKDLWVLLAEKSDDEQRPLCPECEHPLFVFDTCFNCSASDYLEGG